MKGDIAHYLKLLCTVTNKPASDFTLLRDYDADGADFKHKDGSEYCVDPDECLIDGEDYNVIGRLDHHTIHKLN